MVNSGMMICSFFLKKRYSRGNVEDICKLNSEYTFTKDDDTVVSFADVFEILGAFCGEHYENVNDEKKSKTFSIDKNSIKYSDADTYRTMSFTIISGAYGIESDMTDSNTNEILFHRDTHVADNKKFNVLFFVPKDIGDASVIKGILIFQTIATYGVKDITVKRIKAFIKSIGLSIDTRSVSVGVLIEKLINDGGLHKITLIKDRISLNDADNMLISSGREAGSGFYTELSVILGIILSMLFAILSILTSQDYSTVNDETQKRKAKRVLKTTTNAIVFDSILSLFLMLYGLVIIVLSGIKTIEIPFNTDILKTVASCIAYYVFTIILLNLLFIVKQMSKIIEFNIEVKKGNKEN